MDVSTVTTMAALAAVAWLGLACLRGGFWRADQRLPAVRGEDREWPAVAAVIPARNEAAGIGAAVSSLLAQEYPALAAVVVVDDESEDSTAARARDAAGGDARLSICASRPRAAGWTGKLWAVAQGIEQAAAVAPGARYLLLTDADIVHHPDTLKRLVDKAESGGYDLVSLLVLLHCSGFWERLLIPAFVFFFQKLYPFPWVNDPRRRTAAAAGGCMLVRGSALQAAGGIAPIRDRLIDDCALAQRIKRGGPIWLGLSEETRSLRAYRRLGEIWAMVARSAYTQLGHSPAALAGTVSAMVLLYLVPPISAGYGLLTGDGGAAAAGGAGWLMMAALLQPTLALYRLGWWRGALLPAAGVLYTLMTVDSARRHWLGRGGTWKGRGQGGVHANGG